jgi:hypothetical protein
MRYLCLYLLVFTLSIQISAQQSSFDNILFFNTVQCKDSTLNQVTVFNIGDQALINVFILMEILDLNNDVVYAQNSEIVDIQASQFYPFQMILKGDSIGIDGMYQARFTILADNDSNPDNVSPPFGLTVKKCCRVQLLNLNPITCFGDSDASIEIEGTGGTAPYSYFWGTGSNDPLIIDLGPGSYDILMFDASGCIAKDTFIIIGPDEILPNVTLQHESAPDADDGTAEANPTGGTPPYSYMWSTGATTPDIVDLTPGSYGVTITDVNECQIYYYFDIDPYDCDISGTVQGPSILCPGETDNYTAMGQNGTPPYSYLWSTGASGNSISVASGNYSLTITDDEGCTSEESLSIDEFPPIIVDTVEIIHATGSEANGSVEVDVFGGTPPYAFSWRMDDEEVSDMEDLIDAIAGDYQLIVLDIEDCAVITDTLTVKSVSSVNLVSLDFKIFPNPVSDLLFIKSNVKWSGKLYSPYGQEIMSIENAEDFQIDTRDLTPGIYWLRLQYENHARMLPISILKE